MAHYLSVKESIPLKRSTREKKSPRFPATLGAVAIVLVVIGVVAAAMLSAAREPSRSDIAIATVEAQPEEATAEASAKNALASETLSAGADTAPATRVAAAMTPANAPEEPAAKKASVPKTPSAGAAAAPATRAAAAMTPANPPEEASAKNASPSTTPSAGAVPATKLEADTTPANAPHESAPNTPEPTPAAVTITGCLERHDETFRLKDTTGVDAPRSRSWRSGFLKKGSASIEVVDAANRLKLTDHVGQRVSVTGVLVDREIQVRSLQRVATSCTAGFASLWPQHLRNEASAIE